MSEVTDHTWMRELDFLRAFAILGIVAIHVGAFSATLDYPNAIVPITEFIAHLSDFGIPLFFFVSGFVLVVRYYDGGRRERFYRRRFMAIVPPYLVFSTAYLVYAYVALGQTSLYRAAWSYLLFDATGILWFLAVILQLYLLYPFLAAWLRRLESKGQAWKLVVYAALLYVAWYAFLEQATAAVLNAAWQLVPDFGGIVAGRLFPGFLLFFVLGMYLARTRSSSRQAVDTLSRSYMIVPLLLGAVGLQLLGSGFWWEMAVVPYSLVASALLLRLSNWLATRPGSVSRGLVTVGRYSFGIYIAHILVMALVVNRLWALGLGANDALFYVLLYTLTIGVCILGLWALNLLPFGPTLSGVKRGARDGGRHPKGEAVHLTRSKRKSGPPQ
jgi:probable poly-beta-1,6-N-acetyl-D-glucosamine export protein